MDNFFRLNSPLKVIDHQNGRINDLEGNISAVADSTYVPELLKSGQQDYTGLATGDNVITVSLGECTILRNINVPKLFATIELGFGDCKERGFYFLSIKMRTKLWLVFKNIHTSKRPKQLPF